MQIHRLDNVEVNLENGHKYARCDIKQGMPVIKYGNPIGYARCDIKTGEKLDHLLKISEGEALKKGQKGVWIAGWGG